MAKMGFRESNQVKWIGSRPAHSGAQIAKYANADNATEIIHTVTAGKVLYLCTVVLSCFSAVAAASGLFIRDAGDVTWFYIAKGRSHTSGYVVPCGIHFWPPLEVPAGYDVCVLSSAVGASWTGSIFGWEE